MIVTDKIIRDFAELSGDTNPLHLDDKHPSRFGQRIAHGMFVASLISAEIARQYPGAIYVNQKLRFRAPVFIGDEIQAEVLPEDVQEEKVFLWTRVLRDDEEVLVGSAVILCT